MKDSDFLFDHVRLLYYLLYCIIVYHKVNRVGSYIDSPDWTKNKKSTINSINKKDYKCFQ